MEQIELDPFLVQAQSNRLVIEVTLDHVAGKGAVGAQTTSWGVWRRLDLGKLTIGVVVRCGRVWWQWCNGLCSWTAHGRAGGGGGRT